MCGEEKKLVIYVKISGVFKRFSYIQPGKVVA